MGNKGEQIGKNSGVAAVVLAAGRGKRMNSQVPKQYLMLRGYPVLYYALKTFQESLVDQIVLVTSEDGVGYCQEEIVNRYGFDKITHVVPGGRERYHSVYAGLKAIGSAEYVLIHDGARPFITQEIIRRTLQGAQTTGACVAGMPVKDTIRIVDPSGLSCEAPDRRNIWQMQTPQTFLFQEILEAYQMLAELEEQGETLGVTDDAMVMEQMMHKRIQVVEGSYENIKITTPSDLQIAETFLRKIASQN